MLGNTKFNQRKLPAPIDSRFIPGTKRRHLHPVAAGRHAAPAAAV